MHLGRHAHRRCIAADVLGAADRRLHPNRHCTHACRRFPEREQLLDWYQEAVGRNIEDIDFYLSFASWRLASILEGVYSRYVGGAMGDAEPEGGAESFVGRIDALVSQAADYAAKVA